MARIEIYANDNNVTLGDKIIGTDELDNSTKNFTVGQVLGLATDKYISGVALNGATLEFTSTTGAFNGNVSLASIADQTVQISGTNGIAVTGTYPTFTIDGSALASPYTAGTGIDITNGVISSTIVDTDTNTTYDLSATVANNDAYITLAGSDNTNDAVRIRPGANVSFTSSGIGEFTINVSQSPSYSWSLSSDSGVLSPVPSGSTVDVKGVGGVSTSIAGNTLTISSELEEKLVQSLGNNITVNAGGTADVVFRNVVQGSKDITANSVWYNPAQLSMNGYIIQVPTSIPSTLYARLAIGALIDAGGNNQDMRFALMKQTSGTTTPLKTIDFESNKSGVHPFSFFSYLPLEPGSNYWIAISSTTGGVTLEAESQVEWIIQN